MHIQPLDLLSDDRFHQFCRRNSDLDIERPGHVRVPEI